MNNPEKQFKERFEKKFIDALQDRSSSSEMTLNKLADNLIMLSGITNAPNEPGALVKRMKNPDMVNLKARHFGGQDD